MNSSGCASYAQRATGRAVSAGEPVFVSPEGRALCRPTNNLMRVLDRLLAAAGIKRVDAHGRSLDVHALRHTAASRLARHGVPLAVTQRILGHSDPKLTSRVYLHLGVEEMRGAVEAMPELGVVQAQADPRSNRRAKESS